MIKRLNNEAIRQFLKFALVGAVNTIVTLSAFYLLHEILGFYYVIASVVSYGFGILNSYIFNRFWTFKSKSNGISKEFSKFLILNLTGLGLNTLVISLCVEMLNIPPFLSQMIAIGVVFLLNFSGSKFWVFRKPAE